MRLLLDTHVLLWAVFEPMKLNDCVRKAIENKENIISVSMASLWEIAIKQSIGRLAIPDSFFEKIQNESGYEILSVKPSHIQAYVHLPLHHRDPFDRLLIVQSQQEQLTLVTNDEHILGYAHVALLKC